MPGTQLTDTQKRNVVKVVQIGGACVIGFIVAPFIFMSIQGLIGLAVAGAIFLIGWTAFPTLVEYAANMRLVGIKWTASRNPVETLQRDYDQKEQNLNDFLQLIQTFKASIMTFEDKYKGFIAQYPDQKEKFDNILSNMKQLLAVRTAKYKEAKHSLIPYVFSC